MNAGTPPVKIGKAINWFNSFYYRNTSMSFSDAGIHEQHYPSQLHDIRYSSVFRLQLKDRYEIVAIPRLMMRSDLNQTLTAKDLFVQTVLLGIYAVKGNPNFRIGLGIALNNDFERNTITPIGALYYNSKKFKAELIYPNANIFFKYSEKFEFGMFASVDGAISRIRPFIHDGEQVTYFRSLQLLIAPAVSRQIYRNLYGHLKIGFSPVRYYEKLDPGFNPVAGQRHELENNLFVRTGISFRIKN